MHPSDHLPPLRVLFHLRRRLSEICRRAINEIGALPDARCDERTDVLIELVILESEVRDDQGRQIVAVSAIEDAGEEFCLKRRRVCGHVIEAEDVKARKFRDKFCFRCRRARIVVRVLDGSSEVDARHESHV